MSVSTATPRSGSSEELLLDAACAVFASCGFRKATMATIARRANSTKPTLYAHFGSKQDLFAVAVEREFSHIAGALFESYDSTARRPLDDQIRTGIEAVFCFAHERPDGFRLLFGADAGAPAGAGREPLLSAMNRQVADLVRRYGEAHGIQIGASAELIGAMLIGLSLHGARQVADTPGADAQAASDLAAAFALDALRNLDDVRRL